MIFNAVDTDCGKSIVHCGSFPGLPASDLNQYKEIPVGQISFEDITTAFVKMLRIVLVQGLLVANVVLANEVSRTKRLIFNLTTHKAIILLS